MRSFALLVLSLLALAAPGLSQDLVVQRWLLYGPISAPDDSSLPNIGDEGWREAEADEWGRLNLNDVFRGEATEWSAAYVHTYVYCPEDRTILLIADSDDDLVARVNGQRVWVNVVARGLGRGRDTVTVRLAEGWNSLLLKPLNRGGGFGVLGRLAPAESEGVAGLRLALERPAGLTAHNHPRPTVSVGPILQGAALSWQGGDLLAAARAPVVAWGAEPFQQVTLQLTQGGRTLVTERFSDLTPAEPLHADVELPFTRLRRAAIGEAPMVARAEWLGDSRRVPVFVDADRLLRLAGGRIEIGSLAIDSAAGAVTRLATALTVPDAFDGLSIDFLAMGLGPRAQYAVNGREVGWHEGIVELCAPCRAGDSLSIEITPEPGRPLWMAPLVRVREIGYAEYADGYEYARALAGRAPEIEQPDPIVWLRALGKPSGQAYRSLMRRYHDAYAPLAAAIRRDTLHLIGNSHIDAAWLWPWSETIDVIRGTWRTSLKLSSPAWPTRWLPR
ncbi:MAG: hypothetical protein AMS25_04015 [Gemmatimonas sp. SM23_52]|nr:MAG: hypothetical protein AMS25_04015 [Gemmatimonas sp. SM23_52]